MKLLLKLSSNNITKWSKNRKIKKDIIWFKIHLAKLSNQEYQL